MSCNFLIDTNISKEIFTSIFLESLENRFPSSCFVNDMVFSDQPSDGQFLQKRIKSRLMRRPGRVSLLTERRKAAIALVGKPEGKRILGRPKRRW
jgi:hypothetical protein